MPGGWKRMVINGQERAVSADVNRLQAFLGQGLGEMMRAMLSTSCGTEDDDAGGLSALVTTGMQAEILNGYLVQPVNGTLNLTVSAGVMMLINTVVDADADASPYKYVFDAALPTGVISMTANSSGSTRVDVIEVKVSDVETESDTRDLWDTAGQVFNPTLVTKAQQSTATNRGGATNIRVRQGSPGGGFPGVLLVDGWLPLCVAVVPTGTTSNDAIAFWDVRPLISDRAFGVSNSGSRFPTQVESYIQASSPGTAITDSTTSLLVTGTVRAILNGRWVGGILRSGGITSEDNRSLDLYSINNRDNNYVVTANANTNLFLVFPQGLPRWARYTAVGASPRVPRSPRGIPIVTNVHPDSFGHNSATVRLPAAMAIPGVAAPSYPTGTPGCIFVAGSPTLIPSGQLNAKQMGFYTDGKRVQLGDTSEGSYPITGTSVTGNIAFALDFTRVPRCAKSVRYSIKLIYAVGESNLQVILFVAAPNQDPGTSPVDMFGGNGNVVTRGPGLVYIYQGTAITHHFAVEFPLPAPPIYTGRTSQQFLLYTTTSNNPSTAQAYLESYRL